MGNSPGTPRTRAAPNAGPERNSVSPHQYGLKTRRGGGAYAEGAAGSPVRGEMEPRRRATESSPSERRARGNPVGIRDCPAAVCRNDRRHQALSSPGRKAATREATASRSAIGNSGASWTPSAGARESEDLPAVPGTPYPAATASWIGRADHQLTCRAPRPGISPACHKVLRLPVWRWLSSSAMEKHRDCFTAKAVHRNGSRATTGGAAARAQTGHGGLLGRQDRRRAVARRGT